jgi:DNA-nicking Smr family endonuclease
MANRRADGRPRRDGAALWRDLVRGIVPLRRRQDKAPPGAGAALPRSGVAPIENAALPRREPPAPDRFAEIDRAAAERLKRGSRPIEARLDLHGMTQAEAHRALGEFVRAASASGRRSLLVITGRGADRPGVLKSAVPRWLEEGELRHHILAVAAAQPRHGGAGALYVLLRRRRR